MEIGKCRPFIPPGMSRETALDPCRWFYGGTTHGSRKRAAVELPEWERESERFSHHGTASERVRPARALRLGSQLDSERGRACSHRAGTRGAIRTRTALAEDSLGCFDGVSSATAASDAAPPRRDIFSLIDAGALANTRGRALSNAGDLDA